MDAFYLSLLTVLGHVFCLVMLGITVAAVFGGLLVLVLSIFEL